MPVFPIEIHTVRENQEELDFTFGLYGISAFCNRSPHPLNESLTPVRCRFLISVVVLCNQNLKASGICEEFGDLRIEYRPRTVLRFEYNQPLIWSTRPYPNAISLCSALARQRSLVKLDIAELPSKIVKKGHYRRGPIARLD